MLGRIYGLLLGRIARSETLSPAGLSGVLSGQEMSLLIRIQQDPEDLSRGEQALGDYIKIIQEHKMQREQKDAPPDLLALARRKRETGKGYEGNE